MNTIYMSESAFRDIVLETSDHPRTETGGILLGQTIGENWFVAEAIDPGPRTVRTGVYFEYNHTYTTHLANKVARRYQSSLRLLGLWHRHPGSLDTFSGTDDDTHREYLNLCAGGIISGLVNIDPEFRMTFYRVERPLRYHKVPLIVGNNEFPASLLQQKEAQSIARGLGRSSAYPLRENSPTSAVTVSAERRTALPEHPAPSVNRSFLSRVTDVLLGPRPLQQVTDATPPRATYDSYERELADTTQPARRASQEQKALLDLLDVEFDFLDSCGSLFRYRISPQEPGYRLEVSVAPPYVTSVCRGRQEFVFYRRGGDYMVTIDGGREQLYEPGLLRRWYEQLVPLPPHITRAGSGL